ncbi:hypothetical protein V7S43_013389 [Phytophthora oleae]|uniref:Uncharacterized protein n=1 Tax=Phytophthora oleae TaxID=2107226 RepID=A0ABD3F838_9STRA
MDALGAELAHRMRHNAGLAGSWLLYSSEREQHEHLKVVVPQSQKAKVEREYAAKAGSVHSKQRLVRLRSRRGAIVAKGGIRCITARKERETPFCGV